MSEYGSSDFPVMGESVAQHIMNMSRKRSPYTTAVKKKTQGRGASPTGRTGGVKSHALIHEANGPACTVKATLYKQNAAEASTVLRNTKMMPSAVGNRDFWVKRQYGQKLQ
jgi:hypothetical protein